jgi:phosphate starvation-inducible PhoH-like protein
MAAKRTGRTSKRPTMTQEPFLKLKPKTIHLHFEGRNDNQKKLIEHFNNEHIIFAVGVAGTGKTYCMVTMALQALLYGEVDKIIVTRPIVEAGEKLGYLPGDVRDKTNPYNAPVLDILVDHLGREIFEQFVLDNKIQIIPLAYTRGRTYNDAMMILDEAQNATIGQTHMFLTRMGENSKVLVTGDHTQIDLPFSVQSGLMHAVNLLRNVEGVGVVEFDETDVQRHFMVGRVAEAYAKAHFKPVQNTQLGIIAEPKLVLVQESEPIIDTRVPESGRKSRKKKSA